MTKNMTVGTPAKLICTFALPLLLGNIFQQFYSMADTIIVGRTISPLALAAVGCTGSISYCILGFSSGLTSGLSLITARKVGADDTEGIRRSFAIGSVLCTATALILTLISLAFARPLLVLLQTPAELLDQASTYLIILFSGIPATILYNYSASIMHAFGNGKTPLFFLIVCCMLNIVLDLVLITLFHMGVAGAAIATVISQLLSGLFSMTYALKKIPQLHISAKHFHFIGSELKEHIRFAYPKGIQSCMIGLGVIIVQFTLNAHGADAIAAYTAAGNINNTYLLISISLGTSMATYVSQNYGAGKILRIKQGLFQCLAITVGISILSSIVLQFADRSLAALYVGKDETAILDMVETFLTIHCSLYWVQALLIILAMTIQSLGNALIPVISCILEVLTRTFVSLILGNKFGFTGLCFANPLAWVSSLIPVSITCFFMMRRLLHKASLKNDLSN